MQTTHYELRLNPNFLFDIKSSYTLGDFCHNRMIISKSKKEMLKLKESIYRNDFLDEVTDDVPIEQWSKQLN